ncbi:hypothetical protein [Rhodoferax saidenbachensis]|uniref:DNA-binding ribbon-helix-helix protein n=1 Tax=Rhodoferax saidenbachensis TaxID=1484693 RepID=A0ABU1ZR48_9BURK|nr:hypothetical protein [Rhodoferax saidenbachensis]MDR7307958.1 putative DNA-binding ribbon-helix-helix protein [Rhodoferax saidenbachensis]
MTDWHYFHGIKYRLLTSLSEIGEAEGMTVAELIAHLQQQPQDAVVVQPRNNELADAYIVFGLCSKPLPVQMRAVEKLADFPLPIRSYEIAPDGDIQGVILE